MLFRYESVRHLPKVPQQIGWQHTFYDAKSLVEQLCTFVF